MTDVSFIRTVGFRAVADAIRPTSIVAAEVVGLAPQRMGYSTGDDDSVMWRHALPPDECARLHALVVALPPGTVARCHQPGFGIDITSTTYPEHIRVSFCWECSNAYAGVELTSFDPASPEAAALLGFFKSLAVQGELVATASVAPARWSLRRLFSKRHRRG